MQFLGRNMGQFRTYVTPLSLMSYGTSSEIATLFCLVPMTVKSGWVGALSQAPGTSVSPEVIHSVTRGL